MPKQKTHSGAKKRFKLTGSGKVCRYDSSQSTVTVPVDGSIPVSELVRALAVDAPAL